MASYLRTGGNTGLGDYIHLRKTNYLRYGFFRSGGAASQSFAESTAYAYRDLRNLMIAKVQRNGNTRLLEILLTDFYQGNLSTDNAYAQWGGVDVSNLAQQERTLTEAVLQKMPEYYQFDRSTMTVQNPGSVQAVGERLYKMRDGQKRISSSSLQRIHTYLEQTWLYLQNILTTGRVEDPAEVQQRMAQVDTYRRVINNAISELSSQHRTYQNVKAHGIPYMLRQLEQLNIAMHQPTTTQLGTTGEIGVLAGLSVLNNRIDFTVNDLLSGLTGGAHQGHSQRSAIYANFNLGNGQSSSVRATQDTVDIRFEATNPTLFGHGVTTLGASIKNYATTNWGVGIISGVTLETILGLTGPAFANHYLNRVASHEDGIVPIPESANNVIKYALAVRGITGMRDRLFGKLSNYLIIIERDARRVRVYDSYSILQRLSSHPEQFNDDLVDISGFPIAAGSIRNVRVGDSAPNPESMAQRITNIIAHVRRIRLSMSLSPAFFT